jgi:hypothetical protein
MAIGDLVLFNGRHYYLRGIDPMSVSERRAQLEDAETGELTQVLVDEIEQTAEGTADGDV